MHDWSKKMATSNFTTVIQKAYKDFWTQISTARAKGEHELRRRFFETVIEKGLGYPKECIHTERDRTDIWLTDTPPSGKYSEARMRVPKMVKNGINSSFRIWRQLCGSYHFWRPRSAGTSMI